MLGRAEDEAPVRVAVVGGSAFAREHLLALGRRADVVVTQVVSTDPARAATAAALVPGARATTDPADVLADQSVDGVDIVNATPDHARWVCAAARAGRHVHVDKPIALTLRELDEVERAVADGGATLLVGQTVRFQPAVAAVARAVAEGRVGRVRYLHLTWYTGYVWPGGWRGWQHDPARSGGHPVHNGVHAFDTAVSLLGRSPSRVMARPQPTWSSEMPSPDGFHAVLRFGDDALAVVELAYALRRPGDMVRRVLLAGEDGTVLHDSSVEPDGEGVTPLPPASVDGALDAQFDHWVRVLRGQEPPVTQRWQVRAALATGLAAQRSLLSGRPEDVP